MTVDARVSGRPGPTAAKSGREAPRRPSKVWQTSFAIAFVAVIVAATVTWIEVAERLRAPDPVPPRGTPAALVWSERVFRSEAELAAWLRGRKINYARWVRTHPAAVSILRSRDRAAADAVRRGAKQPARVAAPARRAAAERTPSGRPTGADARIQTPWLVAMGAGTLLLLLALGVAAAGSSPAIPSVRRVRRGVALAGTSGRLLREARRLAPHLEPRRLAQRLEPRRLAQRLEPRRPLTRASQWVSSVQRRVHVREDAPARPFTIRAKPLIESPAEVREIAAAASETAPRLPLSLPEAQPAQAQTVASAAVPAEVPSEPSAELRESTTVTPEAAPHAPVAPLDEPPARAQTVKSEKAPTRPPRPRKKAAKPAARRATRKPARDDAPLRPVAAAAEAAAPDRAEVAAPMALPDCEVRWWRGYISSQFCAVARGDDGTEMTVGVSPTFPWRKSDPPPETPQAVSALRTLVEALEQDGWTVAGSGDTWFSVSLLAP